jgi:hypothetical protein
MENNNFNMFSLRTGIKREGKKGFVSKGKYIQ